jgi:hypothetical protein
MMLQRAELFHLTFHQILRIFEAKALQKLVAIREE